MNIPCPNINPCNEDLFAPYLNLSAEAPDFDVYIGVNHGNKQLPPPLGSRWQSVWCLGMCTSSVSQADADQCAANAQLTCVVDSGGGNGNDGGGGGDGGPPPPGPGPIINPETGKPYPLYSSDPVSCKATCPDGTVLSKTLPAGYVTGTSQMQANNVAKSLCQKQVSEALVCLTGLDGFACADPFSEHDPYSFIFTATGGKPPFAWSVSGGQLPTGLTLETDGTLHGIPTEAGDYSFTVQVADAAGTVHTKDCTFHVLGIKVTSPDLPGGKADQSYSYQLQGDGGAVTYSIIDGSLPTGLTMDDAGNITGTPTAPEGSVFTVAVSDNFFNTCSVDLRLTINGPKITCPPAAVVCVPYSGDAVASPPGSVFTPYSARGLTVDAAGHITGTPTSAGSIVLTATDPDGNTNSKTCNIIALVGVASAVEDMAWTGFGAGDNFPNCAASFLGSGGVLTILAHGDCDGTSIKTYGETISSHLRNCGTSNYNVLIKVDYNIPPTPACGANPNPTGDITVIVGGVTVLQALSLAGNGTQQISVPMNAGTPSTLFSIVCDCRGNAQSTFNVSLTPPTPP